MPEKSIRTHHDIYRCTADHPMPQDISETERRKWVHTDFLGYYDGVYNWAYDCQSCGARFEASRRQGR